MKKSYSLFLAGLLLGTGATTAFATDSTQTSTDTTKVVEVEKIESTDNNQLEQPNKDALIHEPNPNQNSEDNIIEEVKEQIKETKKKLDKLLSKNYITKEQYDQLSQKLETVTNLDEWNSVSQLINEALTDSGYDNGAMVEELNSEIQSTKERLQKLLTKGKLTQEEYDSFLENLKEVESLEELNTIKQAITDKSGEPYTDPGVMMDELKSEIQRTKDYLKDLLDKGKLSKEKYDNFLKELETVASLDDLNTVKQDIRNSIDETTKESSNSDNNSTQNNNKQLAPVSSSTQKTLPKTGEEKNTILSAFLGTVLLSSSFLVALLKKGK
ncbi:LPXTG cell wall anchor domain-containing protein [Vagococcus carniphilus]|uniref:LPXTG cell wall anchor domain-containing protein n=1 Tax=Vagococcus carniphilus TaxID=218144 RepID=A0AAW8UE17_9ENTE|nr:LPXTG cell wall anchor domain-containing protein [Vagococcus carniphilus]MDT2835178.1 LPXTG cell wall anchor domain-containing protein [Vagococcus carniphilus]